MARTSEPWHYTCEELSRISGWPVNRIHKDASRRKIKLGDISQVAVWLAANGPPDLRAAMARHLIHVVLGTGGQTARDKAVAQATEPEALRVLFDLDANSRQGRARKIAKSMAVKKAQSDSPA